MSDEKARRAKELRAKQLRAKAAGAEDVADWVKGPSWQPGSDEDPRPLTDQLMDPDVIGQAAMKNLDLVGRTLDLPGGLARTAWKATEDIPAYMGLVDREPRVGWEELKLALQGRAPSEGLVVDVLKDPLTYTGFGPLKDLLARAGFKAGKNIYKGGMRALDAEVAKYGKEPVSDVLMEHGVSAWTMEGLQKEMDDLVKFYEGQKNSILKAADEGRIPPSEVSKRIAEIDKKYDEQIKALGFSYSDEAAKVADDINAEEVIAQTDPRFTEAQRLAEEAKRAKDEIIDAAEAGRGRASMREAMEPLQQRVNAMKASGDPALKKTAQVYQKEIDEYLALEQFPQTEIAMKYPTQEGAEAVRAVRATQQGAVPRVTTPGIDEAGGSLVDLPVQSQYQAPYRVIKDLAGEGGEQVVSGGGKLPIGSEDLTKYDTALPWEYRRSKPKLVSARKIQPKDIGPIEYNPNLVIPQNVQMSRVQTVPGEFTVLKPNAGYVNELQRWEPTKTLLEKYVTPSQASGYKSSVYNKVGSRAYNEARSTPIGQSLEKTKGAGLRKATETAVERSVGLGDELSYINDRTGRLLSSKEKAAQQAAIEARKPVVSQTKGAVAVAKPEAAAVMKALEIFNRPGPSSKIGMGLMNRYRPRTMSTINRTQSQRLMDRMPIGDLLPEQNLLYSPWVSIKRYNQEEE